MMSVSPTADGGRLCPDHPPRGGSTVAAAGGAGGTGVAAGGRLSAEPSGLRSAVAGLPARLLLLLGV